MNAYFDTQNPDKVVHKGGFDSYFDDLPWIADSDNTRKIVLNFCVEDLREEYKRIKELNISDRLTGIKYVCNVSPYYYFQFTQCLVKCSLALNTEKFRLAEMHTNMNLWRRKIEEHLE